MKAVILAAGRGIRMNHRTTIIPKCLLDINGKTIIEKQLLHLKRHGIKDIFLVLGHQYDKVLMKLHEIKVRHVNILFNNDYAVTNNMFSLFKTKEWVKGNSFVLLNGDAVVENKLFDMIVNSKSSACPYDSENFNPEELKVLIKDKLAYKIMPKITGPENSNGSTIGVFKFSAQASTLFFDDMEKTIVKQKKLNEWFEHSLTNIFPKTKFKPLDIKGLKWIEIDDPNDLSLARGMFE
ncbi:MAG: nucleotidyl transferase [uncultured bacterium]|nr:MAG: nucleotidyl transferase [uncultured bacterium]